jgi:DNA-binding response OmpR family regulator
LIIDDDPTVTLTLTRMLEHQGHAVDRAESGPAGYAIAMTTPPDAIILDMKMPGMNGLDFLRQLRADARLKAVPVGIITGDYFLAEPLIEELATLGARVWYKPVWMADLSDLTTSLLSQHPES